MPEQITYTEHNPPPGSFAATAEGCTCPPGMHQTGNVIYVGGYKAWRVTVGCPVHDAPPAETPAPRTELVRQLLEIRARILAAGYPPLTLEEINGEAEARTCATCNETSGDPFMSDDTTGPYCTYLKIYTADNFGCNQWEPRPETGQEAI